MPIRDYIGFILSLFAIGALYWGCTYEIQQIIMEKIAIGSGGKYSFLTILNMYLHIFYYVLCIINFFFGSNTILLEERSILQKIRDLLFAGAAFPIGTFVCLSFWGLYHFDRKLIFPESLDKFIPPIYNHVMHTLPAVAIWLESLLHYHYYPSRKIGLSCLLILASGYTAWLHYLNYTHWLEFKTSLWLYPILNELSFIYRNLYFLGAIFFIIGLYFIGEMYTLLLINLGINNVKDNKKKA